MGALQGPHRPRNRVRRRGLPHRGPGLPAPGRPHRAQTAPAFPGERGLRGRHRDPVRGGRRRLGPRNPADERPRRPRRAAGIAASLEANPEDPKALLGPIPSALPASFDEVISPTGAQAPAWHPLGTADEARAQTANAQQAPAETPAPAETAALDPAEAALDAATTRVEAAPTQVPQASPEPRTETAMRGIPVVEAEDPALAESEVSDLVVRARKILSDLPGSIAPQE